MVQQVIPNWFVSVDDLASVAPEALQKRIKQLEESCCLQPTMPEQQQEEQCSLADVLEYETAEEEAYRLALASVMEEKEEEEKEDWAAQIQSINYEMMPVTSAIATNENDTIPTTSAIDDDAQMSFSEILTSCSEATAEATNVAKETTREAISKSRDGMEQRHERLSSSSNPLQVVPAWIITGDDIAQIAPESCQSPIRYMEDHCICQRMPDTETREPLVFRRTAMQEEEKIAEYGDGDDISILDDLGDFVNVTQEKANLFLLKLNARAPLEPPNPKRPGESHFIEEDMMELLETV